MKTLVTGATGFIGRRLVSELLGGGHSVVVLGRDQKKAERIFGNAVGFHPWNPEKEEAPRDAFRDVEAVIHLAGEGIAEKRWSDEQKRRIRDSRVLGTRHLVSAMNGLSSKPKVFISSSAIGLYGDRGEEELDEGSAPGTGFLSDVCTAWEAEAFKAEGVRTVAVRTGIVLGREGGALSNLLPIFSLGLGGPVGNGKQWMSWIHVDDLVALYIEVSTQESYRGPVNGVASEPVTNAGFSKALGKALHRPAILPAPAFALKLAMGELSVLVLSSQKVLPKEAAKNGFRFQFPTIEAALGDIAKKKEQILEAFQFLPKSSAEVFPFFSDERNLETITPPWLNFHVTKKSHERLCEGAVIDYSLRVRGIPIRWQSKIVEWNPGMRFVDEQVTGPYRVWHHSHDFLPVEGGTIVRDRVRYEVPRVPMLNLVLQRFVEKDLDRIFAYRRDRIAAEFGGREAR